GIHQTVGARARAAGGHGGASGAGSNRATQPTDPTAGSVLHDTGVHSEDVGAGFGAQVIGIGNVEVVAGDVDVEIVFERKSDGIVNREIELSVTHEGIDARRIS